MTKPNTNKEDSTSSQEREELEHEHKWDFAELEKGQPIYSSMAVGMSVHTWQSGKKPDVAKYVCVCGQMKRVTLTDNTKDTNPPEPKTSESYYLPKDRQRKLAKLKDNTKSKGES